MNCISKKFISKKQVCSEKNEMEFFIDSIVKAVLPILQNSILVEQEIRKNIKEIYKKDKETFEYGNSAITMHTKIYYEILKHFKNESI